MASSTYDAFLSFRGEDTRYFAHNLGIALSDRGIHTFIDDENLLRGEELSTTLVKAIEKSSIAIIVLSKNYASSSFCLDELEAIIDCKSKGLPVLPIFYKVDPLDVRQQKGSYGEAMTKHQKRFKANKEKLLKWKMALRQVADLSGYHLNDGYGYGYKSIEKIADHVSRKINLASLPVADYPVGLRSQVLKIRKLLNVFDHGFVMICIFGIAGVGKSTLARAVYNSIDRQFDGSCFLENVREKSNEYGLNYLQRMITQRLQRKKKVLLILDDVDNLKQLEVIIGRPNRFSPGSRVIFTTRDRQFPKYPDIIINYEVKELNRNDALELVTLKALRKEKANPRYLDVLNRVVTYVSCLPLALEVIGSNLFGKSIEEWESAMKQYKRIPKREILNILKVSFDALEEEEKSVFLDIACFFKGYKLTDIEVILHAHYGQSIKHHIGVLVEKSLLKLNYFDDRLTMHDLIEDMGKKIVRKESAKETGKHRRITSESEIKYHFTKSGIKRAAEWDASNFKRMQSLEIRDKSFQLFRIPNYFLQSLGASRLYTYHSNLLTIVLDNLSKKLENLTILNFDKCNILTLIPDISGLSNLKELSFRECENLTTVHDSVGFLNKLKILSAIGCSKLMSFPPLNLTSLERLELSNCSSLVNFPEILGKMENIKKLELFSLPIKELPVSFQNLIGLEKLLLMCGLVQLQSSIIEMPKLRVFEANRCKGWQWVKSEEREEKVGSTVSSKLYCFFAQTCNLYDDFFSIGFMLLAHVTYLDLTGNNITFLPECIKEFHNLDILDVSNCKHLQEIREVPPKLKHFRALNCISLSSSSSSMMLNQKLHEGGDTEFCLPGASIPEWFNHQSRGPSTSFWFRNTFNVNVLCILIAPVVYDSTLHCPIPMVFINGKVQESGFHSYKRKGRMLKSDHTYLFDLIVLSFNNNLFEVPLEKEWKHVEVTYEGVLETSLVKAIGIHVIKHESSMKDIRFSDPYSERKVHHELRNHPLKSIESESAINQYDSVGLESCSDAFSYDVFLSFRGLDTLHGFTGYLYKALHDSGIHTFIDNENLQRGEEITPTIVKAIEESRIAIIVLSINYSSSYLCLDELATILDCLKRKRLLVLPVFYNVDPTQVRWQRVSYGEALAKHEERLKHKMEKLDKWKMALHQVANLSGFHIKHGATYEYELIGKIVEWVSKKINRAHYLVGLGSQVLEVMELLDVGSDDGVHMIGIHGIGGIGKSTLVQEVYNNLIADHFDASCFIENVREKSNKHGLLYLQSILFLKLLGEKDINLTSVQQGASVIQRRLQQKKVLLVLDDVDQQEQLQAVVGRPDWFGPGSRVIISTRDKQLLAYHDVQRTYEVKELDNIDALQLLKWKAFKMHYFDPRYEKLLNRAVTFASGLPLALEVIGSNLYGKSVEEWKSAIHQFEKSPNNPIQTILIASFNSLEEKERSVFLDIACCFKGYELAEVEDILQAHYGQSMKCYIDVLVDKSLVKLRHGTKPCYDTVTLHDLIEDMGKDIVRQESLIEPGERRRLWLLEDVREVLRNNTGTSKIEIICLDLPIFDQEEIVEWDGKAFQNIQHLKTLIIRNGNFSKGPEYLPNSLRVLEWWRYPSNCLPSDFRPKELAICKLPCSRISTIELTNLLKNLVNLRVLNFSSANV